MQRGQVLQHLVHHLEAEDVGGAAAAKPARVSRASDSSSRQTHLSGGSASHGDTPAQPPWTPVSHGDAPAQQPQPTSSWAAGAGPRQQQQQQQQPDQYDACSPAAVRFDGVAHDASSPFVRRLSQLGCEGAPTPGSCAAGALGRTVSLPATLQHGSGAYEQQQVVLQARWHHAGCSSSSSTAAPWGTQLWPAATAGSGGQGAARAAGRRHSGTAEHPHEHPWHAAGVRPQAGPQATPHWASSGAPGWHGAAAPPPPQPPPAGYFAPRPAPPGFSSGPCDCWECRTAAMHGHRPPGWPAPAPWAAPYTSAPLHAGAGGPAYSAPAWQQPGPTAGHLARPGAPPPHAASSPRAPFDPAALVSTEPPSAGYYGVQGPPTTYLPPGHGGPGPMRTRSLPQGGSSSSSVAAMAAAAACPGAAMAGSGGGRAHPYGAAHAPGGARHAHRPAPKRHEQELHHQHYLQQQQLDAGSSTCLPCWAPPNPLSRTISAPPGLRVAVASDPLLPGNGLPAAVARGMHNMATAQALAAAPNTTTMPATRHHDCAGADLCCLDPAAAAALPVPELPQRPAFGAPLLRSVSVDEHWRRQQQQQMQQVQACVPHRGFCPAGPAAAASPPDAWGRALAAATAASGDDDDDDSDDAVLALPAGCGSPDLLLASCLPAADALLGGLADLEGLLAPSAVEADLADDGMN